MLRTDDPIAAYLLKYAILALDLDLALARLQELTALPETDLGKLKRVSELLVFARDGQKLFKRPRLTHNAVAAMSIYETVERSAGAIPGRGDQEVLKTVEELVHIVEQAKPGGKLTAGQAKAAKRLRLFFAAFRNDALGATSRPIETVNFPELQIVAG